MCNMKDTHHWRGYTQSHALNLWKSPAKIQKKNTIVVYLKILLKKLF